MNYKEPNKNQELDVDPVEALRGLESMKNIFAAGEAAAAVLNTVHSADGMRKVAILSGAIISQPDTLEVLRALTGTTETLERLNRTAEIFNQALVVPIMRR